MRLSSMCTLSFCGLVVCRHEWMHVPAARREKQLGPNDPQVAAALTNMGQLLQRQGRFEQAEPLLRRAVEIQEECHGDTHLQVATVHAHVRKTNEGAQLQLMNVSYRPCRLPRP